MGCEMARRRGAQEEGVFPRPDVDGPPRLSIANFATGQKDQVHYPTCAGLVLVAVVDLTFFSCASTSNNSCTYLRQSGWCRKHFEYVEPTGYFLLLWDSLLNYGKTTSLEVGLCLALKKKVHKHLYQVLFNIHDNPQREASSGQPVNMHQETIVAPMARLQQQSVKTRHCKSFLHKLRVSEIICPRCPFLDLGA